MTQDLEPTEGVHGPQPVGVPHPGARGCGRRPHRRQSALALLPIGLVLGLVSLVLRHRRADAVERLQLRWFVAAVTFLLLSVVVAIVASSVLPDGSPLQVLVEIMFGLSLVALPIACAVAVLRYRLYEIDRIVSRTVSYLIVSLLVLGTYALVVTSVSTLLPESNTLAVAGATLAAAAVFRPVLRRVQGVVDRRFNRARFDAVHEVDDFAARLRDSVDPDVAAADLVAMSCSGRCSPQRWACGRRGLHDDEASSSPAVGCCSSGCVVLGFGLLAVFGLADLEVWFFVAFISGAATGLVLSIRRPANALGWTFLAFGSIGVLNAGCYVAAVSQVAQSGPQDLGAVAVLAAWFSQTTWVIILALATVFPLLLFPEGLQSRRWRPVLWLAITATSVISLSAAFVPRLQDETLGISVDNPIAPAWLGWLPEDPENNPVSNIAFMVLGGLRPRRRDRARAALPTGPRGGAAAAALVRPGSDVPGDRDRPGLAAQRGLQRLGLRQRVPAADAGLHPRRLRHRHHAARVVRDRPDPQPDAVLRRW